LGTACQSIEFRTVALCIVSKSLVAVVGCCRWLLSLVAVVDSYNGVISEVVNRKSRHDVFKECAEDAKKSWKRTASKSVKK